MDNLNYIISKFKISGQKDNNLAIDLEQHRIIQIIWSEHLPLSTQKYQKISIKMKQ